MLRAMLTEDFGEYERIAERLEQTNSVEGNNLLVAGAFYEAVNRRFGNGYTIPAIISSSPMNVPALMMRKMTSILRWLNG